MEEKVYSKTSIIMSILSTIFVCILVVFTFLPCIKMNIKYQTTADAEVTDVTVHVSAIDMLANVGRSSESFEEDITRLKDEGNHKQAAKLVGMQILKTQNMRYILCIVFTIIIWLFALLSIIFNILEIFFNSCIIPSIVFVSILAVMTLTGFILNELLQNAVGIASPFSVNMLVSTIMAMLATGQMIACIITKDQE